MGMSVARLRPVAQVADGPSYLIRRTELDSPGTPYVIAAFAEPALAQACMTLGTELHGREGMESDPALSDALQAWAAGDGTVRTRERAARALFGEPIGRRWHPSMGPRPALASV
jgi:hypothetical protein